MVVLVAAALETVATVVLVAELADGLRQALVVLQLQDKETTEQRHQRTVPMVLAVVELAELAELRQLRLSVLQVLDAR